MLQLSQEARKFCTVTLRQLSMPTSTKCLRMIERSDGVVMSFELPRNDDELFHHRGRTVLAVPSDLADKMSDSMLDVRDDGNFVLTERAA